MDCLLYIGSIVVMLSRYWDYFFGVAYWNISNKSPFYFREFTNLIFKCSLYSSLILLGIWINIPCHIAFLTLTQKYIIQRDNLFFFLQKIIITIITNYSQVVKMCVFLFINSFYWSFSHLSLYGFISTALLFINNSTVVQFCLFFNYSIRIYFFILNFFILYFSAITVVRFLLFVFYTSLVSWTGPCYRSVSESTILSSPLGSWIYHIWFCWIFYLISFISFWFF